MDQQIGKKLMHFTDSASKETLGQVHAGGFLHHSIRVNPDGTSTPPSQLSNAERKQRITETWQRHLARFPSTAKRPVIAHRLVFSMSKEQHDALTDAGVNPDQVLHSTLKKVMRRFNKRFHPNDSIGYAYGLHHDTADLHVHVAFTNATPKSTDSRPLRTEALNINSSRIAPRSLFDYQCEALVPVVQGSDARNAIVYYRKQDAFCCSATGLCRSLWWPNHPFSGGLVVPILVYVSVYTNHEVSVFPWRRVNRYLPREKL